MLVKTNCNCLCQQSSEVGIVIAILYLKKIRLIKLNQHELGYRACMVVMGMYLTVLNFKMYGLHDLGSQPGRGKEIWIRIIFENVSPRPSTIFLYPVYQNCPMYGNWRIHLTSPPTPLSDTCTHPGSLKTTYIIGFHIQLLKDF